MILKIVAICKIIRNDIETDLNTVTIPDFVSNDEIIERS